MNHPAYDAWKTHDPSLDEDEGDLDSACDGYCEHCLEQMLPTEGHWMVCVPCYLDLDYGSTDYVY